MSEHSEKVVRCPKCEKEFICSHSSTCWCSKYELNEQLKSDLKEHFSGCLCEDCLKEITESKILICN